MSHTHGGDDHDHDHSHDTSDDPSELGVQYSLYSRIDLSKSECLNEKTEGSGKTVFKAWEDRLDFEKFVESDVDEELLFNIAFTARVKLKGLIVLGGEGATHPSKVRLFKNRPHMTFDDVGIQPDQEFEMQPDSSGTLQYPVKAVKFPSVSHLALHFPSNFGAETTKIYYIGLKGEYREELERRGVVICNYEVRPSLSDHKTDTLERMAHEIQ